MRNRKIMVQFLRKESYSGQKQPQFIRKISCSECDSFSFYENAGFCRDPGFPAVRYVPVADFGGRKNIPGNGGL